MNPENSLAPVLEKYILENIPITSAMGISVTSASANHIFIRAPFENNINHKKTVFGGSLHAVATLACWGLLHLNLVMLMKYKIQIVIASSQVDYLAPVASDFQAEAHMPDPLEWQRFIQILKKKGQARIKLRAKITVDGKLCLDYYGMFVAVSSVS